MFRYISLIVALVVCASTFTTASALPPQRRNILTDIGNVITVEFSSENGFSRQPGVMAGFTALTSSDSCKNFTGNDYCDSAVYGVVVAAMEAAADRDGSALQAVECSTTMVICCAASSGDSVLATDICQMLRRS